MPRRPSARVERSAKDSSTQHAPRGLEAELSALLEAGDHRAAAARARAALGTPHLREEDREIARAALARVAPERGAVVAAVVGFAFVLGVALLGLAR